MEKMENIGSIPGLLRGWFDPDGAEAAAVLLFNDLPACRFAVDAWILAELSGIGAALQPEHQQRAQKRPCGPDP